MMRVLYLKHRMHWCEDCCEGINAGLSPLFFQIAAYLRARGVDLTVREFESFPLDLFAEHDCVVFTVALQGLEDVMPYIKKAKGAGLRTILVLHDSFDMEEMVMEEFDCIDFSVLYPDREVGLADLLNALAGNKSFKLPSVIFRENGSIVKGDIRKPVSDLNYLGSGISELEKILPNDSYTHAYLTVGRGCYLNCSFCDIGRSPVRNRHPEVVAEELWFMKRYKNLYTTQPISLIHPLFSGDTDWTVKLCDEIIKKRAIVPWRATTHYKAINKDLLAVWRRAGCFMLGLGLEHVGDYGLKSVDEDGFRRAIAMIREAGIVPSASVIVGIWEDDDNVLSRLENYIRTLGEVQLFVTPLLPIKSTPIYETYLKKGIIKPLTYKDYNEWKYTKVMLATKSLNIDEVNVWRKRIEALSSDRLSGYNKSRVENVIWRQLVSFVGGVSARFFDKTLK